jgi:short-subunit dehydrogenase
MGVTFITGASSGIGRSLARRMALTGEVVVAVARRQPLLDSLVNEIAQVGGRAVAISCDVTDRASVFAAVRQVEASVGSIDRLIANAGGGEPTFVETFTAAHMERVYALNVGGTANCLEAILPGMLARRSGHIVAVSSLAAYRGVPSGAAYAAAKAALATMLESLRIDLKPWGVEVTILFPGFVRTRASQKSKPFQIDVEDATVCMYRAIVARRRRYAFPLPLAVLAKLGQLLPAALYDRLLAGRGRKPKQRK